MAKIKIQDESGDKRYFTIIPNFVLNHSTIWDREVYIQMKRIAGEDGTCWTSLRTLAKQCGIGETRLKKSIKYLLDHKWIGFVGKKQVITRGGAQEVNEYKVVDLWDTNNSFYQEKHKGGSLETPPTTKGGSRKEQRGVAVEAKGGSPRAYKEEPIQEDPLNKNLAKQSFAGVEISKVIKLFEGVNPSIGKYYGNTTQRAAIERMLKVHGREKLEGFILALPKVNLKQYWPKSTTPVELENNLGKYKALSESEKAKNNNVIGIAL